MPALPRMAENSITLPALFDASTTSIMLTTFRGILDQQRHQLFSEYGEFIELLHADMQTPQCPGIRQLNDFKRQILHVAAGCGFRNDAYADMGGDHPASGFEIADLYPKAQHASQVVGRLKQEGVDRTGFRKANVVIGQCFIEVDNGATRQRVIHVRDQHQSVGTVGKKLDVFPAANLGRDPDVCRTVHDCLDDLKAQALAQFDRDVAVLAQVVCQDGRHEFVHGGCIGVHPYAAFHATGVLLDIAPQVLQLTQDHTGVLDEGLAGWRKGYALTAAVQQGGAQMTFEIFNAVAGRRQRKKGSFGPFCHAVSARDVHHKLHVSQVEVHGHVAFSSKLVNLCLSKRKLASCTHSGKVIDIVIKPGY